MSRSSMPFLPLLRRADAIASKHIRLLRIWRRQEIVEPAQATIIGNGCRPRPFPWGNRHITLSSSMRVLRRIERSSLHHPVFSKFSRVQRAAYQRGPQIMPKAIERTPRSDPFILQTELALGVPQNASSGAMGYAATRVRIHHNFQKFRCAPVLCPRAVHLHCATERMDPGIPAPYPSCAPELCPRAVPQRAWIRAI